MRTLHAEGYGGRKIADAVGVSYGTVRYFLEQDQQEEESFSVGEKSLGDFSIRAYVWDLETSNLKADIGNLLVASFLNISNGNIETRTILDFVDGEAGLAWWAYCRIEEADILIGHNTKAFDVNFLNGVLARYDLPYLPPRQHLDTYLIARYGFKGKTGYSMENLADFFRLDVQKYKPSKHDWRESHILTPQAVEEIAVRCEEDVKVNLLLWNRLRPYWHKWKGW